MRSPARVATRIWAVLTVAERAATMRLLAFMLVATLLEAFAASLIALALRFMTDLAMWSDATVMKVSVTRFISDTSRESMILFAMAGLMVTYLVKNVFLAFCAWQGAQFAHRINVRLSQRLFELYLAQPYLFHLYRNSAHLANSIDGEVAIVTETALTAILLICAESLVLVGLGTLLLVTEPVPALTIGCVIAATIFTLQRVAHPYVTRWGAQRQYHQDYFIQHLHQGLSSVKEVILLGRAPELLKQFFTHNEGRSSMQARQHAARQLPRLVIELVAIGALVLLTVFALAQQRPAAELVPTLALFTVVAFRTMPSVNRIVGAMHELRYAMTSVDRVYDDIQTLRDPSQRRTLEPLPLTSHIEVRGVTFSYPGAVEPALENLSLRIERGESVGIIGASGAGKSTLVDLMLGLLHPQSGLVLVDGRDVHADLRPWQEQIGYVQHGTYLTDDTFRRNIAFGIPEDLIDDAAVLAAVESAQLDELVSSLPDGLATFVGERGIRLSAGERQRVGIARALYHDPPVLVLDEATSALDSATERGVMSVVHAIQRHKTVVIIAHRYSTLANCDRIYELRAGAVQERSDMEEFRTTTQA